MSRTGKTKERGLCSSREWQLAGNRHNKILHSVSKTKERGRMYHKWRERKMAKYRKLGRTSSQRKALLRGQVTQLLANGKIVTTETKAKEGIIKNVTNSKNIKTYLPTSQIGLANNRPKKLPVFGNVAIIK